MSNEGSPKSLLAIFFLVAAGFLAVNNVVRAVPLVDYALSFMLALVGIAFIVWQMLPEGQPESAGTELAVPTAAPTAAASVKTAAPPPAPVGPVDDLERVEGVGPKYRDALIAAGITTFEALAKLSAEQIAAAIASSGMGRTASMATWAEQAALAAAGDWEALNRLQSRLKGGVAG